jgi:hypothetical protein
MNTVIESAFVAAAGALPELSDLAWYTGVSSEEMPVEGAAIIVHCPECDHSVGPLWKATVHFRLESPAFEGDRAAYDRRLNALREWLDKPQAVSVAFQPKGLTVRGYFVRKSQTSLEHSRWVAEIEVVVGVDTTTGA